MTRTVRVRNATTIAPWWILGLCRGAATMHFMRHHSLLGVGFIHLNVCDRRISTVTDLQNEFSINNVCLLASLCDECKRYEKVKRHCAISITSVSHSIQVKISQYIDRHAYKYCVRVDFTAQKCCLSNWSKEQKNYSVSRFEKLSSMT